MPQPASDDSIRPVHSVRYGAIQAAVWRNQTKNGPMYNVTVNRSYRQDSHWHDSISFGYGRLTRFFLIVCGPISSNPFGIAPECTNAAP